MVGSETGGQAGGGGRSRRDAERERRAGGQKVAFITSFLEYSQEGTERTYVQAGHGYT